MKRMKRIASAALSIAMLAGMAASSLSAQMTASAAAPRVRYTTVTNQWQTRINAEKTKFPHGKYWNHKTGTASENGWSSTPCNHAQDKVRGELVCNTCRTGITILTNRHQVDTSLEDVGQCYGFAQKLSQDIWGTNRFYRTDVDSSYEPRIGDNVRLTFTASNGKQACHSIFITGISGEQIYFAECNGGMEDCKIKWDQYQYYTSFTTQVKYYKDKNGVDKPVTLYIGQNATNVTKSYLRAHASFYERPQIKGDFNLNGKIDSQDAALFQSTYLATGNPGKDISIEEYDINGDLKVTEADYSQIQYYAGLNYVDGVIDAFDQTVTYKDRNSVPSDSFIYDNGIYSKIDSSTASFLGLFKLNVTSKNVLSYVYQDGKRYKVTAIGEKNMIRPGCTQMRIDTLSTIGIPDTVTTINKYAFSSGNSALTKIIFTGSNPGLTTIEDGAFFYCTKLTTLDLTKCKNLQKIGRSAFLNCSKIATLDLTQCTKLTTLSNSAFEGCSSLTKIDLTNCSKLTSIGDSVFTKCTKLANVMFPTTTASSPSAQMNMSYGVSTGMFNDASSRTNSVGLFFFNNSSSYRTIVMMNNDAAMWRSGKLGVMVAGKIIIKDQNGNTLYTGTNAQVMQVRPR